jgi:hypothetical protein
MFNDIRSFSLSTAMVTIEFELISNSFKSTDVNAYPVFFINWAAASPGGTVYLVVIRNTSFLHTIGIPSALAIGDKISMSGNNKDNPPAINARLCVRANNTWVARSNQSHKRGAVLLASINVIKLSIGTLARTEGECECARHVRVGGGCNSA